MTALSSLIHHSDCSVEIPAIAVETFAAATLSRHSPEVLERDEFDDVVAAHLPTIEDMTTRNF